MNQSEQSVLVLVAHPDDEVLGAGATLAKLARSGARVHVGFATDGGQGRNAALPGVAEEVGFTYSVGNFSPSNLVLDRELVSWCDGQVEAQTPALIVTHSRCGGQSQDHSVLSQATRIAQQRLTPKAGLLLSEPTFPDVEFRPTFFSGVQASTSIKARALATYAEAAGPRDYLSWGYSQTRLDWWGLVAGSGKPTEAFEVAHLPDSLLWGHRS